MPAWDSAASVVRVTEIWSFDLIVLAFDVSNELFCNPLPKTFGNACGVIKVIYGPVFLPEVIKFCRTALFRFRVVNSNSNQTIIYTFEKKAFHAFEIRSTRVDAESKVLKEKAVSSWIE